MWLIEHPDQGLLEPEDLDHEFVLDICKPYLGPVVAVETDWTPLKDRGLLSDEHLDRRIPGSSGISGSASV